MNTPETDLRNEFKKLIVDLSMNKGINKDKTKRYDIYKRLDKLYKDGFRHCYSDIFAALVKLEKSGDTYNSGNLRLNIEAIMKGYTPINKNDDGSIIDVSESIKKLYDHINLETARIEYTYNELIEMSDDAGESYTKIRVGMGKTKNELAEVQRNINSMRNDIAGLQKEHINILGIFAGIVLSFVGGAIFTSSVLQNIGTVSIGRLVLVLTLVGFVLINGIYGLLYYIYILTKNHRNDIYKIKTLRVLAPIVIINLLFAIILVLNWYFNFKISFSTL